MNSPTSSSTGVPNQRQRLDVLVVERGLAESREKARALILAGQVLVNGQKADKAGTNVDAGAQVELLAQPRFVGRGGLKLEAALDHFREFLRGWQNLPGYWVLHRRFHRLPVARRGAARVYAIDVGTAQLDWKLRTDPRVIVQEQVNARYLGRDQVPEPIALAVCDVSFISITMILPALMGLLAKDAEMVILVKPQFELEREQVGKGGIIRDPALHHQACQRVEKAVQQLGFQTQIIPSPILGAEGNREFLLHARR